MEREWQSMREGADPFDACTLAELRKRRSEKWATYPPDVLPAFVAEMDVALADPISRTLSAAIARGRAAPDAAGGMPLARSRAVDACL